MFLAYTHLLKFLTQTNCYCLYIKQFMELKKTKTVDFEWSAQYVPPFRLSLIVYFNVLVYFFTLKQEAY